MKKRVRLYGENLGLVAYGEFPATTGYQESLVWSGVGYYSPVTVNGADVYGGADNPDCSNHFVQGANGPAATTLTLEDPVGFFGLWWSAGDNQNVLEFYLGTDLVARFTTESLLTGITAAGGYMGNPASGIFGQGNGTEPYAFVNFFGEGDATWDRHSRARLCHSRSAGSRRARAAPETAILIRLPRNHPRLSNPGR